VSGRCPMKLRIGLGFDSHQFEEGKPLFLGGVRIESPCGLKGHSDGDALLHALTDAVLGALGEPDIGSLFSDTEERWRNASSEIFLREALRRMRDRGYSLVNVDCVLVADRPRVADHRERIRENLSRLLGIPKENVSVKGKRREGLEAGEGLLCICTVLLERTD